MEEDAADKAAEHEAGDGSKPRNGIKSKWEKYKKDFAAIQVSGQLWSRYYSLTQRLSSYSAPDHV